MLWFVQQLELVKLLWSLRGNSPGHFSLQRHRAESIILICTNKWITGSDISVLIPPMVLYSLRDIFESRMDLRKTLTAYMSPAVKRTSCSVRASQAEPKPFSKSSMKSAPLAQQKEANESNGGISDTLIL